MYKRFCISFLAVLLAFNSWGTAGWAAGLTLPPTYPGIEAVLTQVIDVITTRISPEQYSELQALRSELLKTETMDQLLAKLKDIGVDEELSTLINKDVTLDEAKAILSIMITVASVDSTTDVAQVAAALKQLRQDYQDLFVKLAEHGISQQTLYAFFVDLNNELSQIKGLNKNNIEEKTITTVSKVLTDNPDKYAGIIDLMGVALVDPDHGNKTAEEILAKGNYGEVKDLINDTLAAIDFELVASMYALTMDMMASIYYQEPPKRNGGGGSGTPAPATQEANQVTVNQDAPTTIAVADQGLNIIVPEAAFTVPDGAIVKAQVVPLATPEAVQVVKQFIPAAEAANYTMLGTVLDIEFFAIKDGEQTQLTAQMPIKLDFSLEGLDLNDMVDYNKLGIWKLDDVSGEAIWVGGKVNTKTKTISLFRNSFSKYVIMEYDKSFADVKNHWAKQDIESLASKAVVRGDADNNFAPNATISRAEFAAMLVRLLGLQNKAELQFKDIKVSDWYQEAVAKAVQGNIVYGYDDDSFRPQAKISREEMAVMMARAYQNGKPTIELTDAELKELLADYTDQSKVQSWAQRAVAITNKVGIVKGQPNGSFNPGALATRAEAAVMINRLWNIE